jgi:hypothetical protein
MEPADLWERCLDRPFGHYVGWLVQPTDTIGARITDATWRGAFSYAIPRGFDSQAYLDDLDRGDRPLPYWPRSPVLADAARTSGQASIHGQVSCAHLPVSLHKRPAKSSHEEEFP